MSQIAILAHDIRSTHNVGSILRSADGFGINSIYLTGYTPYPILPGDNRMPHLANKLHSQIAKTALGAEKNPNIKYSENILDVVAELKLSGYVVAALEQTSKSVDLSHYKSPEKIAVIVGSEVKGLDKSVLRHCDVFLEIPMLGDKESFNVAVASAVTMYHLRFIGNTLIK